MTASPTHLVLIPSYNTGPRLRTVVAEALAHWQPVFVVLDGCTDGSRAALADLEQAHPRLTVIELSRNQGKGAAVLAGAAAALARGYTHALVMDADGQHPAANIAEFMAASCAALDALVLGRPIFPPNIPRERLHGRKLSVGLVRLELLGAGIDDPLFGFRVYPLRPLLDVLGARSGGRRYDFDTEAAIRLGWAGVRPLNLPAPVRYFAPAEGGVSHFHYVRDNATLVWMHTRLIAELFLRRWPALLRHRREWRAATALMLLALLRILTPASHAAAPTAPMTEPTTLWEKFDPAAPDWSDLFAGFAAKHDTMAEFVERRHFSFHKKAVELTGTVRVSQRHGLSLAYAAPEARTIILDDRGVLLRDARGDRAPPSDARAVAVNQALSRILRFNFAALAEGFEVRGRRTGARWTLVFTPRTDALRRTTGEITVTGDGATVTAIELRRSARQFVEIHMSGAQAREGFSAEEVARFFR